MQSLIMYDSNYGSTKAIAEEIANELKADIVFVDDFDIDMIKNKELLILGTPIIGWQPTVKMQAVLKELTTISLVGIKIATFDTRIKLFIHGDAMNKMMKHLQKLGGQPIIESNPFYVKGRNGVLLDGELLKASKWALKIKENCK